MVDDYNNIIISVLNSKKHVEMSEMETKALYILEKCVDSECVNILYLHPQLICFQMQQPPTFNLMIILYLLIVWFNIAWG